MKRNRLLALALCLIWLGCAACAGAAEGVLYQVSTLNALLQGIYDGPTTVGTLLAHGDFGLGTFTHLDGEMVVLDGTCYQVRSDGQVVAMPDTATTPFAAVTTFTTDLSFPVRGPLTLAELEKVIDDKLPTLNLFYALKITSDFDLLRTRSVPRQEPPYLPLATVVQHQSIFEMHDVQGTIVALRSPAFVAGINVPGYHLHFLRADKQAGGHVLDGVIKSGVVDIEVLPTFTLALPSDPAFAAADLTTDNPAEVHAVEK